MKKMFKRGVATVLSAAALISTTSVSAFASSYYCYGDTNNDGNIDLSDAVTIIMAVSKFTNLTGSEDLPIQYATARPDVYGFASAGCALASDVNGDGIINIDDSDLIQKYILQLPIVSRIGEYFYY